MKKTPRSCGQFVPSDITPYDKFLSRRALLAGGVGIAAAQSFGHWGSVALGQSSGASLTYARNAAFSVTDTPNSYKDITTYNNFYEFGTDKSDPAENAQKFRTSPWNITVGGEAEVTGTYGIEDILKRIPWRNASIGCAASRRGP